MVIVDSSNFGSGPEGVAARPMSGLRSCDLYWRMMETKLSGHGAFGKLTNNRMHIRGCTKVKSLLRSQSRDVLYSSSAF